MKLLLKRAAANDFCWSLLGSSLVKAANYAQQMRSLHRGAPHEVAAQAAVQRRIPDLVVRHGPFQGMKYPASTSVGSQLFPKLLGSYEREIAGIIEDICRTPYSEIVDIGCAEGYYAVGLAMRIPTASVYAYDTNSEAIRLCEQMAVLNGVDDRVAVGAFCDIEALKSIPFTERSLIISDCEGYEKVLFTEEMASFLTHHDLLIEVHDFLDLDTSAVLRERFKSSHDIHVVQSLDDIKKAQTYDGYDELEGYSLAERRTLVGEFRPAIMEWFYMQSRASKAGRASTSGS